MGRVVVPYRTAPERALAPGANGATEFEMREIWRSMPDLGPSFERFAKGLKARAEGH